MVTLHCSKKHPLTFVFRSRHPDFQHLDEQPSPSGSVSGKLCGRASTGQSFVELSLREPCTEQEGCREHVERDRRCYLAFCIISKQVRYGRALLHRSAVMKGAGGRAGSFEHNYHCGAGRCNSKGGIILKDYNSADNRQKVCLYLRGSPLYYLPSPTVGPLYCGLCPPSTGSLPV